MQRLVTIIVTVIFLLAVYPNFGNSRVAACSCLAQEGVQDYADNATGVFRGKLTDQSQFSGSMMFEYIGWKEVAALISKAFVKTVGEGIVTYDFARQMEGATEVSTSGFADALIKRL